MGYFLAAVGGFIVGVVITCILLSKKNMERYEQMGEKMSTSMGTTMDMAKAIYNTKLNAYDNEEGDGENAENESGTVDAEV